MDRDYWRSEPTRRLVEEARTKGCELCRALGERLEDADDEARALASEMEDRAIDTDREIANLNTEIEELREKLRQCVDRIEELEDQFNKETK
jgi:uncharacterized coiled-coil DUF342 family protein